MRFELASGLPASRPKPLTIFNVPAGNKSLISSAKTMIAAGVCSAGFITTQLPAAKAGAIGLTKSAAKELASRNITVNAIAPGYIETDMTGQLSEDVKNELTTQIPLKRIGSPEDVAQLVSFIASDEAGYITGQTISVNGGLYM